MGFVRISKIYCIFGLVICVEGSKSMVKSSFKNVLPPKIELNNDLTQKEIIEVLERCCFSIEKRWEKLTIFTEKGRKSIEI